MRQDEVLEILVSHIYEILPYVQGRPIEITDDLESLGADSVERAEIVMMTMESLSLNNPRVDFAGTRNLGELADRFAEKLEQAHE